MIQIIKTEIDYSQLLSRQIMLLLIFLHFSQYSLGVSAPVGKPISEAEHRAAIPLILAIYLLKYLGGFLKPSSAI